jgi:hypothetical protein
VLVDATDTFRRYGGVVFVGCEGWLTLSVVIVYIVPGIQFTDARLFDHAWLFLESGADILKHVFSHEAYWNACVGIVETWIRLLLYAMLDPACCFSELSKRK